MSACIENDTVCDTQIHRGQHEASRANRTSFFADLVDWRKKNTIAEGLQSVFAEWREKESADILLGRRVADWTVCTAVTHSSGVRVCACLHSPDGKLDSATSILDLTSDEEEADTRIVLHWLYATHTSWHGHRAVLPWHWRVFLLFRYSFKVQIVYGHWSWWLHTRAKCTCLCKRVGSRCLSSIAGTAYFQWMWQHKLISSQKKHSAM